MSDLQTPSNSDQPARQRSGWLSIGLPLLALAGMVALFALTNPLGLLRIDAPPIEDLHVQRVRVVDDGFNLQVINNGPDTIHIAQVLVDDAYWSHEISPSRSLPPLGSATLHIPYPWVAGEAHEIVMITDTGITFEAPVEVALASPTPGPPEFLAFGLIGLYVGVIPVILGMLWYPAMRQAGSDWLSGVLALTLGLLVFLLIDTLLEAIEIAGSIPGVFQGVAMVLFAALVTWLALLAIGNRRQRRGSTYLAAMIAFGIGFHNLGEGLAIGAAFALGEAALGSFLVIGFTLHNITEGIGIAAPLLPGLGGDETSARSPSVWTFAGLALLAGAPAIVGAWIGGFAYSPTLAALFLGVGVGAIWQVIVEVGQLLRRQAERQQRPIVSWVNLAGFVLGLAIMYGTAFLVAS